MKPIFTIHAGEYLVAAEIEKSIKSATVWIPSKDTGIDLLLTNSDNTKTASIQVKFSKDFNPTHLKQNLRSKIKGSGWWTLNRTKIEHSQADFWVFVLYSFQKKSNDFIIIKPQDLLKLFDNLNRTGNPHCYITVTENNQAFETRGISHKQMQMLCDDEFVDEARDLTLSLNNWEPIVNKLK